MTEELKVDTVLGEKISGLIKLTDERFSNLKEALIRIEANNLSFATKTELEETKRDFNSTIQQIRDGFMKHNADDKESFGGITKGQKELRDIILKWVGALAVIAILLPIVVPIIFHFWFKF